MLSFPFSEKGIGAPMMSEPRRRRGTSRTSCRMRISMSSAPYRVAEHGLHLPGADPRLVGDTAQARSPRQDPYWLLQTDSGRVYLDGEEVRLRSVQDARAHGHRDGFQDLGSVDELSVFHNLFLNRTHGAAGSSSQEQVDARRRAPRLARWRSTSLPSTYRSEAVRRSAPGHRRAVRSSRKQ